jgi:GH24 family phage-related lysozyme (muramidase)
MPRGVVTNKIRLLDLFRYYKQLPHQTAAITELEEAINKANPHILGRNQAWFKTWRQAGKQQDYTPALHLIKEFEGCHLSAYPDPLHGWSVATIGYGTTRYPDGRRVAQGDKITVTEAEQLLQQEVDRIAKRLAVTIPYWGEMRLTQQCALISFAYNLGADFYGNAGFETISRNLREKAWTEIPATLKLYRNPGTSVEAGLLRRRVTEGQLWAQTTTTAPTPNSSTSISLKVPYEWQLDNGPTGYRECFSSSCAMVARYWGKIAGDHEYNRIRRQFGDTTDPKAQILTLKALGLHATFEMEGTTGQLENELRSGYPTPVGWLHRGPANAPTGSGHWSVVTGFTPTHFIHNDPNGEADIVNGGYVSHKGGAGIAYSRRNWLQRWLIDGPDSGWFLKIRPT